MAIIRGLRDCNPVIGENTFLAETATLIGSVSIGDDCSIWYGAVLRGDVGAIRIGDRVNIQDNAVLHATYQQSECIIGNDVSIGHGANVHGCVIGNDVIIGMGAIVMDNTVVPDGTIIAAGAVVPANQVDHGTFLQLHLANALTKSGAKAFYPQIDPAGIFLRAGVKDLDANTEAHEVALFRELQCRGVVVSLGDTDIRRDEF